MNSTDSTYTSNIISIELKPNETKEFIISQSFIFKGYSWSNELKSIENSTFKAVLDLRKAEKNTQLRALKVEFSIDFNS